MLLLLLLGTLQDPPLVPAEECRPRAGLPRFVGKAERGGAALKVAYLGGSITAQPGWRVKSLELFRKTWPGASFSEIHAAIGGTGSDLGVFRLQQDVIAKGPDLVFVEFAVNDGGAAPDQILRCMEGIVRQLRRALPDSDVCFVYTITEALVGPMLDGRFPRAASTMEKVADHYGIPSIHLGMEVARLAKAGKLRWKAPLPKTDGERRALGDAVVFAPDAVHPYPETGHELYVQAIARSLPAIRAASREPAPKGPDGPLVKDHYERARMFPVYEAQLSKGFVALGAEDPFGKSWASRLPALHRASEPGERMVFRFKGTRVSIYDVVGPDGGQVTVSVDGGVPRLVPRFDAFCTYHRLSTFTIATELPDGEHTVVIEVHPGAPDKAAILAKRGEKMDTPERFAPNRFHPGAILLVGELLK